MAIAKLFAFHTNAIILTRTTQVFIFGVVLEKDLHLTAVEGVSKI